MFEDPEFRSVLFDLSDAEAIDSTTLGLMAKISLTEQDRFDMIPVVLATNPGIQRILQTMGFGDIFTIVDSLEKPVLDVEPLVCETGSEEQVKARVLEAHQILMGLNQHNAEAFRDLVQMLQNS